jgi:LEA14-like dessication related protein
MRRLALALPLLAVSLTGCPKLGNLGGLSAYTPKLHFQRVEMHSVTFQGADADFVFQLVNPNPIAVKVASFTYDLKVAGSDFAQGDDTKGVQLVARGNSELRLPVSVVFADLIQVAKATKGQDNVPFGIAGTFGFDTPLGTVRVPYQDSGQIPVLRPPKVRLVSLEVTSLQVLQHSARLELDVGLTHQQGASLDFRNLGYHVSLGGAQVAGGTVPDAGTVAAGQEKIVALPLTIDLLQVGTTIATAITKKQPVDVGLGAAMQVTTPIGAVPLNVNEAARLAIH